jgi:transcriptional regulator with XRE-family HTH domain
MDETERREALADFLRTRRMRLSPEDVGLPPGFRRRTPGLRREEVAQLANIGISWYTSLEQGRDVKPSEQVLECLAQALRLTPDERRHLFLLALQYLPAQELPTDEQVSPGLERMVKALDPNPAYIMGRRWDLLTWNRAADHIFNFHTITPPYTRNMLWRIFTNAAARKTSDDWTYRARGLVAQFRADSARYPGDPAFTALIDDLQSTSPEFRQWWSQHDVLSIPNCHKEMQHPTLGYLEFEYVILQVPDNPDLKMVVYTANPATAAKLASVLSSEESSDVAVGMSS